MGFHKANIGPAGEVVTTPNPSLVDQFLNNIGSPCGGRLPKSSSPWLKPRLSASGAGARGGGRAVGEEAEDDERCLPPPAGAQHNHLKFGVWK